MQARKKRKHVKMQAGKKAKFSTPEIQPSNYTSVRCEVNIGGGRDMIWQPWGGKWYRSYLKSLWRKKRKIKYFDLILIPHNQTFLFETCNKLVSLLDRFLVLKSNLSKSGRGLGGAQIEVFGRWVGLVDSTASASIWLLPSAIGQ